MTEYFDVRCGDDVDLFARDAPPLEVLAQDIYHWLITPKQTLLLDPDWGFGLEIIVGQALPTTLADDIVNGLRRWDRVADARCTIKAVPGEQDSYRLDLAVECDEGFLELALAMSPDGIVRVAA